MKGKNKNDLNTTLIQLLLRSLIAPEKEFLESKRETIKSHVREILNLADASAFVLVRFIDTIEKYLPDLHEELGLKEQRMVIFKKTETSFSLMKTVNTLFKQNKINFVFMKSLDHFPDAGNDVDIIALSKYKNLINDVLMREFSSKIKQKIPTFSERIAQKVNYQINDNPILEVHYDCLGQMGDMPDLVKHIFDNASTKKINFNGETLEFPYPDPYSSLMLHVLQRVYRHFYIRLSDIVNGINMLKGPSFNLGHFFEKCADLGVNPGAYCYLSYLNQIHLNIFNVPISSDFQKNLDSFLPRKERISPNIVIYKKPFYRVPLKSIPVQLYLKKVLHELKLFNLENCFRLSLIPFVAAYAIINLKLGRGAKGW